MHQEELPSVNIDNLQDLNFFWRETFGGRGGGGPNMSRRCTCTINNYVVWPLTKGDQFSHVTGILWLANTYNLLILSADTSTKMKIW